MTITTVVVGRGTGWRYRTWYGEDEGDGCMVPHLSTLLSIGTNTITWHTSSPTPLCPEETEKYLSGCWGPSGPSMCGKLQTLVKSGQRTLGCSLPPVSGVYSVRRRDSLWSYPLCRQTIDPLPSGGRRICIWTTSILKNGFPRGRRNVDESLCPPNIKHSGL